jgi:sRNA-binding regulator protein Hfq
MNLMISQFAEIVAKQKSTVEVYLVDGEWKIRSVIGGLVVNLASQRRQRRVFKSLDTAIQYAASNLHCYEAKVIWK